MPQPHPKQTSHRDDLSALKRCEDDVTCGVVCSMLPYGDNMGAPLTPTRDLGRPRYLQGQAHQRLATVRESRAIAQEHASDFKGLLLLLGLVHMLVFDLPHIG